MIVEDEDDFELHQSQRNLALATIDELMLTKMDLLDAEKKVASFYQQCTFVFKEEICDRGANDFAAPHQSEGKTTNLKKGFSNLVCVIVQNFCDHLFLI